MAAALLTDADRFPFAAEERAALAAAGVDLRELAGHATEELVAAARGVDALFVYHADLGRQTIARLEGVRVIARCGSGHDNVDAEAARDRGIEVVYVPDYSTDDVADHAVALLLACVRRVAQADRALRRGAFPSYAELGPMHRLRGRTLGLYGCGRVGRRVAATGRALGLRVLAHDPALPDSVPLPTVLREADYLSLHASLTGETRHAIGRAELGAMKRDAILVNTARGAIVDTGALVEALRAGTIAGAGLDVFEEEPPAAASPLLDLETVVLTPHCAAFTEEGLAELRRRAVADALRVLRGLEPRDPVPAIRARPPALAPGAEAAP